MKIKLLIIKHHEILGDQLLDIKKSIFHRLIFLTVFIYTKIKIIDFNKYSSCSFKKKKHIY